MSLDTVARSTYLRLINTLITAAHTMGPLNSRIEFVLMSQFGRARKDYIYNTLFEAPLPNGFTIEKAIRAENLAFAAGIGRIYELKSQKNISVYDKMSDITMTFINTWAKALVS
jgi:hypothetical protein